MAEKDVELGISGDESGLTAALGRAEAAVKRSAGEMKAAMEGFGKGIANIQTAFLGFAAIIGGGAAMKRVIGEAANWNAEASKLAKALGITTEQASAYLVALHHIGSDSGTLISATEKMSKQIYTNGDAFERLGIHTRDANGHFRPTTEIFEQVRTRLAAIHDPIAKNIEGLKLFGKAWGEVKPLLKLTNDVMAESAKRAQELGLVVGPDGAANAKQYVEQLRDVQLVGEALTIQMGNQLLPVFTQVGAVFSQAGPQITEVFGGALKFIAKLAIGVGGAIEEMGLILGGIMASAAAALRGDFSGARSILHELGADLDAVEAKAKAMQEALDKPPAASSAPAGSDKDPNEDKNAGQSRSSEWETRLAEMKAAYQEEQRAAGSFREFSQQQELAYWQHILSTTKMSLEEHRSVRAKVAAAELAIDKQKFEAETAALKTQEAEYKSNADAKLAIAQQLAQKMLAAYGEDSKQYQEAAKHVVEIEVEKQQQLRQIKDAELEVERAHKLAQVDLAEQQAQAEVAMGAMSNLRMIELEKQFEERRQQIRREALLQERAQIDPARDPVAYAQINKRIEESEIQHQVRMGQLSQQARVAVAMPWSRMVESMTSQWASGLQRMLAGQMSFSQGVRGAIASIGQAFEQMVAQSIVAMLRGLVQQKLMHKEGVFTDAKSAAAGAFKATAGIPYVGPILAPIAAATAFSATMAFAEKGYDVPAGINPVTQLHQKEMVLPADIAEPLRRNVGSGRGMGGGQTVHQHISAIDSRSLARALSSNGGGAVGAALRAYARRGGIALG